MKLVKFKRENFIYPEYGIVNKDSVSPIKNLFSISELFIALDDEKISTGTEIPISAITPLPPTDEHVHIYCAGLNYLDHAKEVRMPIPESPIFFTKSDGALCGPADDIIYPDATSLLDYEIELGVIIGRRISKDDNVTYENLENYVLGLTIINDISARDIQLATGQWFLGKSFRTFAPMGPWIQVLDRNTWKRLYGLNLELQVFSHNGTPYPEKKQSGITGNMIFKVEELINCLKNKFDLKPGDIIATGTPSGVALSSPSRIKQRIAEITGMSPKKRMEIFLQSEIRKNKKYLQMGDMISARIFSSDGKVDLGEQRNRIVPE